MILTHEQRGLAIADRLLLQMGGAGDDVEDDRTVFVRGRNVQKAKFVGALAVGEQLGQFAQLGD